MKKVTWFTNAHEQRNHLLKHGLMRLHRQGQCQLVIRDYDDLRDFSVSEQLKNHPHRHTNLLLVEDDSIHKWVLVDSEDSFFCFSPLIQEVDLYFCAGYNSTFFQEKTFIQPYVWQTEEDVAPYRQKAQFLIDTFGDHFSKVRKFVPIGPNAIDPSFRPAQPQKWINLKDKLSRHLAKRRTWDAEFRQFECRYQRIHQLRQASLKYDVVLADTLWGWPHHRYALHQRLGELASQYQIYSQLKWNEAAAGSTFTADQFPLISRSIPGNYEAMLAASKLAVFSTGFHWGWRNIMALSLCIGLPVYMDEPILEPYFDLNEFRVFYNQDEWASLASFLNSIDESAWLRIKAHNQAMYDRFMAPEKVAEYFINSVV
jgi:hypothetical protein